MARSVRQATLLLLLCGFASQTAQGADVPGFRRRRHGDAAETGATLAARQPPPYPDNVIDMPVDHYPLDDRYKPHTTATFQQHYLFDATYYQPGGPVFLYVGGETSARSRASNLQTGIVQILMNATGGLGVILENRYYGNSYPFDDSTTDHLVYLTNEQTIADAAYFAQHVVFPGINESLTAPGTPWILYGGSLAGGQTAMALKAHGDVLYAGIASSGIISVKLEYPEW
ncbi:hypothetical protein VTK73DRAFT_2616 [Phialemonium thermophilum]|uniref:Peptidase S9 prolyl oligopeptidase catalytic domain-containing protein n=1 Tax=Phialemonium thermophilum TaxID=223376 RepID=A0ABR3VQY5_9PEZI